MAATAASSPVASPVGTVRASAPAASTAVAASSPGRPQTPNPAPAPLSTARWSTFVDGRVGAEFRYPPACPPRYSQASIEVGPRISLDVIETVAPTLDAHVDELLRTRDWRIESRERGMLGDEPTIRVEYRFGGTNRFGMAFFVGRGSLVYTWQFTAGGGASACDSAEVFEAVLDSFRLADIIR